MNRQQELFPTENSDKTRGLEGFELREGFLAPERTSALMAGLLETVPWEVEEITIFQKVVTCPRLTAWYGDAPYSYSGLTMQPEPWTAQLLAIKVRTEQLSGHRFNCVLLNRYRTGRDSMSWHSDDEPELGPNPAIASVSFGASRRFRLRHRTRKEEKFAIELSHGSLLVMDQMDFDYRNS